MTYKLSLLAVILASANALAFDFDGFTTGMSRDKAVSRLKEFTTLAIIEEGNSISAVQKGEGVLYSLYLCKDSLVSISKFLNPAFETFVELFSRYRTLYGIEFVVWPKTLDPTSVAQFSELSIIWRDKDGLITISHMESSASTKIYRTYQTTVSFETRNSCYEVPFLSQ